MNILKIGVMLLWGLIMMALLAFVLWVSERSANAAVPLQKEICFYRSQMLHAKELIHQYAHKGNLVKSDYDRIDLEKLRMRSSQEKMTKAQIEFNKKNKAPFDIEKCEPRFFSDNG